MKCCVEHVINPKEVFVASYPRLSIAAQRNGGRITYQRLGSRLKHEILVHITHGELSWCFVNRVTPPKDRVVCFRNRAPVALVVKQSNHMIFVIRFCGEIHQERAPSVVPQYRCGKQGTLDTVRFVGSKHVTGREVGVAIFFKVYRERV
jgi:hypothetical protein